MSALVDWHAAALIAAGLFTLLTLTWLLYGPRAVARMCCLTGVTVAVLGLVTGRPFTVACGAVTAVVVVALRGAGDL